MKCYNHTNVEAVGICKNCNKGICPECLTEIPNGIACTSSCVEELKLVNELISKNVRSRNSVAGSYRRGALLHGLMGIVFLVYGIMDGKHIWFIEIMGIIFLFFAAINLYNSTTKNTN
ncbi:hypothetical protein [Winogradskyella sp. 3972H.M.0a.05]|uniref:hypothetical protein n=1 Tax=Winogradskyella sp. 3972H.M.0a.05 TaxID=2950277 RepID=UPI00339B72F1